MKQIPEAWRLALKSKRTAEHLSCEQVASLFNVDASTVRRWENGRIAAVTEARLNQLCLFLAGQLAAEEPLPVYLQQLLELYDDLPPRRQQALFQAVVQLLQPTGMGG